MDPAEKDKIYHQKIAGEYDYMVTEPRSFPNDLLFGKLDPLVHPGRLMLDLGCGTGQMMLRYANRFRRVIGVDHSEPMLQRARASLAARGADNCELQVDDLFGFLKRVSDTFDLITCVGCLHHLPPATLRSVLTRVAGLLSQEGVFLFAEPINVALETLPTEIVEWNAASVMRQRAYSVEAEDPDEGPLSLPDLMGDLDAAQLRVVAESRGWELFPHALPPNLRDRTNLWRLHHRFGANGNIFSAVAVRKSATN